MPFGLLILQGVAGGSPQRPQVIRDTYPLGEDGKLWGKRGNCGATYSHPPRHITPVRAS